MLCFNVTGKNFNFKSGNPSKKLRYSITLIVLIDIRSGKLSCIFNCRVVLPYIKLELTFHIVIIEFY